MLKIIKKIRLWYRTVYKVKDIYKINFIKKLYYNIKGFTVREYYVYDLKNNNYKNYISEYERQKTKKLAADYSLIFDNKLIFENLFGQFFNVPKTIYFINKNRTIIDNINHKNYNHSEFIDILFKDTNYYIFKPVFSGGGRGLFKLHSSNNSVFIDDKKINKTELTKIVKQLSNYVVTEFIEQHQYSNDIFSKSTNTIRIITLRGDDGQIKIVRAIHRFGTNKSIPVDNASRGGIFSEVNLSTGKLSKAKGYYLLDKTDRHPDTGKLIEGVIVPRWNDIKQKLCEVASKFIYIDFIAWDVLVTNDNFYVIEGNKSTDFTLLQSFRGEKNTILGDFYRKRKVFK